MTRHHRPYPPDWCDEETAAYLLSISTSGLRRYVAAGMLPEGALIGNRRLWSREQLNNAMSTFCPQPLDDDLQRRKDASLQKRLERLRNGQKGPVDA